MRYPFWELCRDFCSKGKVSIPYFSSVYHLDRELFIVFILSDLYKKQNKEEVKNSDHRKESNIAAKKFISDLLPLMVIFYTYFEKENHLTKKHRQILCKAAQTLHTKFFKNKDSVELEEYIRRLCYSNIGKRQAKDFMFFFYDYLKELGFKNKKINYDEIDRQFSKIKKEIDDSYQFISLSPTLRRPKKIVGETGSGNLIPEKDAVRLSGLSRSSLRRLINAGKLKYINRQGYDKESLNKYLSSKHRIKLSKSTIASEDSIKSDMGKLLTAQEAAKILFPTSSKEVAMRHLNRLKKQKKISYYQLGKKKFYFFEREIKSIN